ncbi:MAG TPA: TIR domain-containing protein, partial [Elainellaceae cyanobacterium]
MAFEDDIFISYTHIDNQPLTDGQKGWISHFHNCLKLRLAQLRGKEPKIWLDTKRIAGNDYLEPSIVQRLPKVALLVSVFSPRYLQSTWCMRELKEFCQAAHQSGGLQVGEKSRLFKVVKTPLERDEYPPETQDLLGYEFFQIDA